MRNIFQEKRNRNDQHCGQQGEAHLIPSPANEQARTDGAGRVPDIKNGSKCSHSRAKTAVAAHICHQGCGRRSNERLAHAKYKTSRQQRQKCMQKGNRAKRAASQNQTRHYQTAPAARVRHFSKQGLAEHGYKYLHTPQQTGLKFRQAHHCNSIDRQKGL